MPDHQGQIILFATAARGPVFFSTVFLHSPAYDSTDVIDDDNLETALSAQIEVTVALLAQSENHQ